MYGLINTKKIIQIADYKITILRPYGQIEVYNDFIKLHNLNTSQTIKYIYDDRANIYVRLSLINLSLRQVNCIGSG